MEGEVMPWQDEDIRVLANFVERWAKERNITFIRITINIREDVKHIDINQGYIRREIFKDLDTD